MIRRCSRTSAEQQFAVISSVLAATRPCLCPQAMFPEHGVPNGCSLPVPLDPLGSYSSLPWCHWACVCSWTAGLTDNNSVRRKYSTPTLVLLCRWVPLSSIWLASTVLRPPGFLSRHHHPHKPCVTQGITPVQVLAAAGPRCCGNNPRRTIDP